MRRSDRLRISLLLIAAVLAGLWPTMNAWAQTQDAINATVAQQVMYLGQRLDKIDSMINAVLVALVVNFIAQIINIRRGSSDRRENP